MRPGPPSRRDPCKQRPLLGPGRGGHLPLTRSSHIPFHDPAPQGSGAAGRAAAGCPAHDCGRSLSWTHRARGPRSGAQDPPKETAPATQDVSAGIGGAQIAMGQGVPRLVHSLGLQGSHGLGPGGTDSDDSHQQNPDACRTLRKAQMSACHCQGQEEVVIHKTPVHAKFRGAVSSRPCPKKFVAPFR